MGCGGASNLMLEEKALVVRGDLFNTDTRNVLTILDMTEVNHVF